MPLPDSAASTRLKSLRYSRCSLFFSALLLRPGSILSIRVKSVPKRLIAWTQCKPQTSVKISDFSDNLDEMLAVSD